MKPLSFQRTDKIARGRQVIDEEVAREVRSMLESPVSAEGTAGRAAIAGYRVAGKTGTVRKPTPGGYSEDRFMSIFAGFAPASAPRLVAVVVVDEPRGEKYYGGQVAAPVFREVLAGALRLLGIAPDNPRELAGLEQQSESS